MYLNRTVWCLLFLLSFAGKAAAQSTTFRAVAPNTVVKGERFRLQFVSNKSGKDLRVPELKGFDVLFGPAISSSSSVQIINGKSTSESSYSYTYTLVALEEGTFTIEPATMMIDGSTYKSNQLQIKVLPPDKSAQTQSPAGSQNQNSESSAGQSQSPAGTVSDRDAFIRVIVSKSNIYEQEGILVSFRLYTATNLQVVDWGKFEFPEFDGFMTEEVDVSSNQQWALERYNDRNYKVVDLRKWLLFPQRSGTITIPRGMLEVMFSVPSGRSISTFFGTQEIMADVKKALRSSPVSINVKPLPDGKPAGFSGAVGEFSIKPSISSQQVPANEPITISVEISGTGNLKLIQNPTIDFPSTFEPYDPTVSNSFNVAANGLTGTRKIEYLTIPRYEGDYTISPIRFSYFDIASKSYKTLESPTYNIHVTKGDPSKATTSTFVNQQDVKVEQDIRFLKTTPPVYLSTKSFFAGSLGYWLWYIVPFVLLITLYLLNRKQARENANVALMRNKKANKTAVKRLKQAERYLKENNKDQFYDEMLRALWGYFSDKLSIPLAQLSRNNIEAELSKYGFESALIAKFMQILDTGEFARYAPGESATAMDSLYKDAIGVIGEMESKLKK